MFDIDTSFYSTSIWCVQMCVNVMFLYWSSCCYYFGWFCWLWFSWFVVVDSFTILNCFHVNWLTDGGMKWDGYYIGRILVVQKRIYIYMFFERYVQVFMAHRNGNMKSTLLWLLLICIWLYLSIQSINIWLLFWTRLINDTVLTTYS